MAQDFFSRAAQISEMLHGKDDYRTKGFYKSLQGIRQRLGGGQSRGGFRPRSAALSEHTAVTLTGHHSPQKFSKMIPFNQHYASVTHLDRAILSNLKRRPISLKKIKATYNPIYTNVFGKVLVEPKKRGFFTKETYYS